MSKNQAEASGGQSFWLVLQKEGSKYANRKAATYEFPSSIPNGSRIAVGDLLIIYSPSRAEGPTGVIGLGHLASVKATDKKLRLARYDKYATLPEALSLKDLGGDPRTNRRNAINAVDREFVERILDQSHIDHEGWFMSNSGPTEFEKKLSPAIQKVIDAGGTGYRWDPVDSLLETELGLPKRTESGRSIGGTRIKRASGSSRGANVLKEGPGKLPDAYFIVLTDGYQPERFRDIAIKDMMANPDAVDVVAIVEKKGGMWRVTEALGMRESTAKKALEKVFPLVAEVHILGTLPDIEPLQRLEPTAQSLAKLRDDFISVVGSTGFEFDVTVLSDALACCLSSQLLMFAGPSGTGKSTLARLLGEFMTTPRLFSIIESRRQWIGPEDVVGYYSPLARRYIASPTTGVVAALDVGSIEENESAGLPPTPILLIEEANLSPVEGYAAPLIHGLSRPAEALVTWDLYPPIHEGSESTGEIEEPAPPFPPRVNLFPYPRIFGTVNVDASALPPARKVSGRAAVLLMEPKSTVDADSLVKSVQALPLPAPDDGWKGVGAPHLQNPTAIVGSLSGEELSKLAAAIKELIDSTLGEGANEVSQRDLMRCLLYMGYFTLIVRGLPSGFSDGTGEGSSTVNQIAAENALLHFILPGLSAEAFDRAIGHLTEAALVPGGETASELGGMLASRVQRLASKMHDFGGITGTVDFWTALS